MSADEERERARVVLAEVRGMVEAMEHLIEIQNSKGRELDDFCSDLEAGVRGLGQVLEGAVPEPKAMVLLGLDDAGDLNVQVEFFPPWNNQEGEENPSTHTLALSFLEFLKDKLNNHA